MAVTLWTRAWEWHGETFHRQGWMNNWREGKGWRTTLRLFYNQPTPVHDVVLPFPFSVSTTTVIIEFDRAFNCFRLSTNERILVFNLSHRSAIAPFGISVETSGLLIVRVIRSTVHWNRIERCWKWEGFREPARSRMVWKIWRSIWNSTNFQSKYMELRKFLRY